MTKLDRPLKREISVKGQPFVVTFDANGLKITQKGRRNGLELTWNDLVSGDAALSSALHASLDAAA
jgi:hypothetical protein